jgi:hypothetical protein
MEIYHMRDCDIYARFTKYSDTFFTLVVRVSGRTSPVVWRIIISVPIVRFICRRSETFTSRDEILSAALRVWDVIRKWILQCYGECPGLCDLLWIERGEFRLDVQFKMPILIEGEVPSMRNVIMRDTSGTMDGLRRYARAREEDTDITIKVQLIDGSMCTLSHNKLLYLTTIRGEANPKMRVVLSHRIHGQEEDVCRIQSWHRSRDMSCIDLPPIQKLAGQWMWEMGSVLSAMHDASGFANMCGQSLLARCNDTTTVSFVVPMPGHAADASDDEDMLGFLSSGDLSDEDQPFPIDSDEYLWYSDDYDE